MMILLSLISLFGFCFFAEKGLKLRVELCPLFASAYLILFLYCGAIFGVLSLVTNSVLGLGLSLFVAFSWQTVKKVEKESFLFYTVFCSLLLFCWWYVAGMAFSVSDDYVYWGAVSKYLYFKKSILVNGHPLFYKHETYTPGLSLFHYFFLNTQEEFSERVLYFSQDVFLVSCFMVAFREKNLTGINLVLLLSLLTTLFFGSVFAKLSVDFFIALMVFALLWVNWHEKELKTRWIFSIPVLLTLFLVKQVGISLAFLVLLLLFIQARTFDKGARHLEQKMIVMSALLLIVLKLSWSYYCSVQGFKSFSNLSFSAGTSLLHFWQSKALLLAWGAYFKSVVLAPLDRLKIPFILWGAFLFCFYHYLLKTLAPTQALVLKRWLITFSLAMLFYVFALGLFELHSFIDLTKPVNEFPGLARYLNIAFAGMLFFIALFAASTLGDKRIALVKGSFIFLIVGFGFLTIFGRAKRLHEDFAKENKTLLSQLERELKPIQATVPKTLYLDSSKVDLVTSYEAIYTLLPNYHVVLTKTETVG